MNSLCIHGAKELGTGQTAAQLNLESRAGHIGKGRSRVPQLRVMNMEIKGRACQLSWGVETSQNREMSTTSCLLLFGESKLSGWSAGTEAVAGLCQRAELSKEFPHVHPPSGRPSARRKGPGCKREHKTQYSNMDEIWKSKSSWYPVVLSAFQTKAILY